MREGFKVALTLSILMNILFIGVAGGIAYRQWSHKPWHKVSHDLSPEARNIVGRSFQAAFKDIRPLGNDARKKRAELIKILSAETFEEEAFDENVSKLVSIQDEIMAMKIEGIRKMAKELPAEDRAKMADKIARVVGGREHRVKRHNRPEGLRRGEINNPPEEHEFSKK
ncbi:MAG: periplasmic heavy metal sensor [Micavibrio sp.]|nr:periplasmic heavy metal sensor [Micavibrio sp.]